MHTPQNPVRPESVEGHLGNEQGAATGSARTVIGGVLHRSDTASLAAKRIGVAKGKFKMPDNIDAHNGEVVRLFWGGKLDGDWA